MKILAVLPLASSLPCYLEGVGSHKNTRYENLCEY